MIEQAQERLNKYYARLKKRAKDYQVNGDKNITILASIRKQRRKRLSQVYPKG